MNTHQPSRAIFTIGHSDHSLEKFIDLIRQQGVDTIFDVRSWPRSRRNPQFDRETFEQSLSKAGVSYFFVGKSLGGRPREERLFDRSGVANYGAMAQEPGFEKALGKIIRASSQRHVALMCSEREPLDCHRCLLVGRALATRGCSVCHILADGRLESHSDTEDRLIEVEKTLDDDLFLSRDGLLDLAYRRRASKVAFKKNNKSNEITRTAHTL